MYRLTRGDEDAVAFDRDRLIGAKIDAPCLASIVRSIRHDDPGLERQQNAVAADGGRRRGTHRHGHRPAHFRGQRLCGFLCGKRLGACFDRTNTNEHKEQWKKAGAEGKHTL